MKTVYTIILMFLFFSCDKKNNEFIKVIKVDTSLNKNCSLFKNINSDTLKFLRKIEIIENTLNDTIILGIGILPPNYLGEFEYTQFEDKDDVTLDLRYINPPANRICIQSYNQKKSIGILKLRLKIQY